MALLHDVLEDCLRDLEPEARRTLLTTFFGAEAIDIVWCVSGFGETRKIRNADMKAKIMADESHLSPILKLADRIANVRASKKGSSYWHMYKKELREFEFYIRPHVPPEMWEELEELLAD